MKILVAVKRVIDANARVRVRADGTGVETADVKMAMNPFCENAVEEAVRLREAGAASEVVLVTVGPAEAVDTLRTGLAMGADRAIHVLTDARVEPLGVAKCLAAVAAGEAPDLVLLGKQAIDSDASQTGPMLAALTGRPQGTFASKLELSDGAVRVTREIDGGLQTVRLKLPAVVTADLRLNEPRYASLPNVMKARAKPVAETTPEALGADIAPRHAILRTAAPASRQPGRMVGSVDELLAALRDEARVL